VGGNLVENVFAAVAVDDIVVAAAAAAVAWTF